MQYIKRGQGGIEFIVILGFVLLFFVGIFAVIQSNRVEKEKQNEDVLLQNLALDVRDELNIAAEASEGYMRNFTVPPNVLGIDYDINVSDGYVYLTSERYSVTYRCAQVNGNLIKGTNTIKKENGEVYLN